MEKRKRTYDLDSIKAAFRSADDLKNVTTTAVRTALMIGMGRQEIVDTIQGLRPRDFYKSMTSYGDHKRWQDVYHAKAGKLVVYVKFTTTDVGEFRLLSFKEKDDGN